MQSFFSGRALAAAVLSLAPAFAGTAVYTGSSSNLFAALNNQSPIEQVSHATLSSMSVGGAFAGGYQFGSTFFAADAIMSVPTPAVKPVSTANLTPLLQALNGAQPSPTAYLQYDAWAARGTALSPEADAPEIATLIMIGLGLALFSFLRTRKRAERPPDDYREVLRRTTAIPSRG